MNFVALIARCSAPYHELRVRLFGEAVDCMYGMLIFAAKRNESPQTRARSTVLHTHLAGHWPASLASLDDSIFTSQETLIALPCVSGCRHRFFEAVRHNPSFTFCNALSEESIIESLPSPCSLRNSSGRVTCPSRESQPAR